MYECPWLSPKSVLWGRWLYGLFTLIPAVLAGVLPYELARRWPIFNKMTDENFYLHLGLYFAFISLTTISVVI